MRISDILTAKRVYTDSKADDKRELLQFLASKAARSLDVDERTIFDALLERESLGSTAFGHGTAFPHARLANIKKVKAFFARLDNAIDFEAVDGQPVDLVFVLISPEDSGADHLTALASISRLLKDEEICKKVRKAKNNDAIYSILSK